MKTSSRLIHLTIANTFMAVVMPTALVKANQMVRELWEPVQTLASGPMINLHLCSLNPPPLSFQYSASITTDGFIIINQSKISSAVCE